MLPLRAPQIGAYVCPRGVFAIQCRAAGGGLEIERSFDVPFALKTAEEAADHLVSVLQSANIARANVSIALRGFGVAHQTLQLPPGTDAVLGPVIEREVRRLEPHLTDCVVQWMSVPSLDAPGSNAPPQRTVFAIAASTAAMDAFEQRLRAAGHRLNHATALPVALQRVLDQFDSGTGTIATIAPLPDGAFIGFSLGGALRLIVEPPLPQDAQHEAAALGEEVELASMFVRQQFRGVNLDRVVLIGARDSLSELKGTLTERLKIPVKQLDADSLSPVAYVALGAVVDAQAPVPQSLGGATRGQAAARGLSRLETASMGALFVLALVGFWTIAETVRTVRAERALATANRRVEADGFGLAPVRATAEQRRLVKNALGAVQVSSADRSRLQRMLAGIASVAGPPVRLDTLRLARSDAGWRAVLSGGVDGTSNARAVQTLHELYRELPQRVAVDSLRLDRLAYEDSTGTGLSTVRFQLSFSIVNPPPTLPTPGGAR
jgi:hypothetical protein